ncbi:MAG: pyruvate, phosphate dikinase [Candidatus Dormibacteraeota bacterium]|uniref:Pyruvate, phosphate dikinase n=1 Tax=Candidatus Dormiibacter inghamiae TaxID=3127013 RepID=A0A934KA26_9BACT|nr:pyruvate, phosphate dikinase [Candidatus Dormibacteraeota bacterium]MBJ7606092.1 pyruvate, phosphate dikinase [Candidatus Dormibacteraeota bacterium]
MKQKFVYLFQEGSKDMRDLLGGKGAGVAEMTRAGMPVPPGFTITTEACREYYRGGRKFPAELWGQVEAALMSLEEQTGKRFDDEQNPLLVSVRSGAKFSMPGMMDTVLNLGLYERTLRALTELTGDERFALDAYRRFIQMYGKIVKGIDGDRFEEALTEGKRHAGVRSDPELTPDQLRELVKAFKAIYQKETGEEFPDDPKHQLRGAIESVFASWNTPRAVAYRRLERIPDDLGTAVNVQMMVFGNMAENSGTGVAFTRNPITGESQLYGDFLLNAQGEDVVAGIRDTEPISALDKRMPEVFREFQDYAGKLEQHYRDVQDLEFTIERGKLYMLQTRSAKRTGEAAVNIAVALVEEGLISREEAVARVEPRQLEQLIHPRVDPSAKAEPIGKGVPASPGAATGEAVFDADRAEEWGQAGRAVILVRVETNPSDVHGMIAARGILTSTGGTASHAALVARGMGRPCIVGASEIAVDLKARTLRAGGATVSEGEEITIDGTTGNVFLGKVPTIEPKPSRNFQTLLGWADGIRKLEVWANGDYPRDAEKALENGAQGIGLCRTEHMFMEEERLPIVRAMIMAETTEEREQHLAQLLPIQRGDFHGILQAMSGLPVVIRLIDPPLHEFLPNYEELVARTSELRATGREPERLAELETVMARVESLREVNPMLGLRGVRLSILYPEITRMQVRAILEAACDLKQEGSDPRPEIMIPLVGTLAELQAVKAELLPVVKAVQEEKGVEVHYKFGTMIEIPRAALTAGEIASEAEFFSFGTNDLTQTTFGYSRDDAERAFIVRYLEQKILKVNPFETIDRPGVGRLMALAVTEGRASRPDLEVGICGEHGGDPDSIAFCHELGLTYVSCSPYRVPVARLAAAQAVVAERADSTE